MINFFSRPSLIRQVRGGNAGLLKCGKGTTYEGGQREPAIARWPGRIKPGIKSQLGRNNDDEFSFACHFSTNLCRPCSFFVFS